MTTAQRLARITAPLVLLAGVLALNIGALTGTERLTAYHDNVRGAYPLRVEAARQWRAGRIPLWNPYKRAGAPLLADIVAGVLYPGNIPFLFNPDADHYRPLEQGAVLHALLAAAFMYMFLRTLDLHVVAAMLGALVFSANGFMVWITSLWIQLQAVVTWTPLILTAVHHAALRRDTFWRWTAVGGLAVMFQMLAGYPELGVYAALVVGAYALSLVRTAADRWWRALVAVAAIYVVGFGLAAMQLLPTFDLAAVSRRAARVSLKEFQMFSASPWVILGFAVPGIAIDMLHPFPTTGTCYLGLLAAALALEGIRARTRAGTTFGVVLVVAFFVAIGAFSPLSRLVYAIPGLHAFRYPFKHLFEVTLCLSVLAALGADSFVRRRPGSGVVVVLASIAGFGICLYYLAPFVAHGFRVPDAHDPTWRIVIAAFGVLPFLGLAFTGRRTVAVGWAVVAVWTSFAGNRGDVLRHATWEEFDRDQPDSALIERLRSNRGGIAPRYVLVLAPNEAFSEYRNSFLAADAGTAYHVPVIHGCCPFLWSALAEQLVMTDDGLFFTTVRQLLSPRDQRLNVLACRYVGIPPKDTLRPDVRALRLGNVGGVQLLEREQYLPPLRFVDRAACGTPNEIQQLLRGNEVDPQELALVDCDGLPAPPSTLAPRSAAHADVVEDAPGTLRLRTRVDGDAPSLLVVSQADLPGWRAHVDGTPAVLYRAYGLVQGVVVPPGEHALVLEYAPASFRRGVLLSSLTALALVALTIRERRRRTTRGSDA
jgi:hypothetical protein